MSQPTVLGGGAKFLHRIVCKDVLAYSFGRRCHKQQATSNRVIVTCLEWEVVGQSGCLWVGKCPDHLPSGHDLLK